MAFIEEAIISGVISKLVNDGADITKKKIKEAVQNRDTKHQTFESQIYVVTIDALNEFTRGEYKREQDQIVDAAEKILIGFRESGCGDIEIIRSSLRSICSYIDSNRCKEFLGVLCHEISRENNNQLYHEIRLIQEKEESRKTTRIEQKIDSIDYKIERGFNEVIAGTTDNNRENECFKTESSNKFGNDKKEDYIDIWNDRLFLHRGGKSKPLTLADAFIMPDFKIYRSIEGIGFANNDTLDKIIEKFIEYDRTSTMLIAGVPGMGKSTITSWIANEYIDDDRIIILRFRDFKRTQLAEGLLDAICNKLCCENEILENKILVLDGFDEMKALDIRENVLNEFFNELKDFRNFKCIFTSRPAYIDTSYFQNLVEIKEFDIHRVEGFYKIITDTTLKNKEKIELNLEVLGIPVILYMAIMSDADISENPTKPELYNRIFAVNGGIFDKFSDGETQYGAGDQVLRNPENIKKYLDFLSDTAFKMFEKDELVLKKDECKDVKLGFKKEEISILEFPIKHLFESTESYIEFIHKSIYEYFVSEYIFWEINEKIYGEKTLLAGVLGYLHKKNDLTPEILEFLKYRIGKSNIKQRFYKMNEAFQIMLQDGLTYYTGVCYKNVIDCEMRVFANMLEILHLWDDNFYIFDSKIEKFVGLNKKQNLNLSYANLTNIDFSNLNLQNINLRNTELIRANLREVDLSGANLSGANLSGANLIRAELIRTELSGADLFNANLAKAILKKANMKNTTLDGSFLSEADLSNATLKFATLRNATLSAANLKGANLESVDFTGSDLREANLVGAVFIDTNLEGVNLIGAIIGESQVSYLEKRYNLHGIRVCLKNGKKIVSYEEYLSGGKN